MEQLVPLLAPYPNLKFFITFLSAKLFIRSIATLQIGMTGSACQLGSGRQGASEDAELSVLTT